jgi:hypothetical protein
MKPILLTHVIVALGVAVFHTFGHPLPWPLGPIIVCLIAAPLGERGVQVSLLIPGSSVHRFRFNAPTCSDFIRPPIPGDPLTPMTCCCEAI